MKNDRGSLPLIIAPLILIILLIAGLFYFQNYMKDTSDNEAFLLEEQENNGIDQCYSQNYFKALSERGFVEEVGLTQNTNPGLNVNRGTDGLMMWKRAGDEPFVEFPRQTAILYENSARPFDFVMGSYERKLEPLLFARGFVKDSLNSQVLSGKIEDEVVISGKSAKYSYVKGNTLLQISLFERMENDDLRIAFAVACGIRDKKYDNLYSQLIFSASGKKALEDSSGSGGLKNMILSIWDIHKNNIVRVNIGSLDWFSGHSAWFQKINNEWEVFFTGQDSPLCSMLEVRGIEEGVRCSRDGESFAVTK